MRLPAGLSPKRAASRAMPDMVTRLMPKAMEMWQALEALERTRDAWNANQATDDDLDRAISRVLAARPGG